MSKKQETGEKGCQLKNAKILMVSRFKPNTIGGIPSTIESLERYWNEVVEKVTTIHPYNRHVVNINDKWDLIIFHHPSASWIDRFLTFPEHLKSKSSVIWHQAVDKETLKLFRELGAVNSSHANTISIEEETAKRRSIARYPGVLNYAISEAVRESLIKSGILQKNKISVVQIPPALPDRQNTLNEHHERDDNKFTILVVSRISPEKGIENVLDIYSQISNLVHTNKAGSLKPINFVVVGDAENTAYKDLIMGKVKSIPTNTLCSIEFLGKKSREGLSELYKSSHVLLMPSLHDSWGLVTIEALHYGLPVVAFTSPGSKEIFSKSENEIGSLVDSPEDGTKSIIDMIIDSKLRLHFSNEALKESKRYQPEQISLNLLKKLWNDRYLKK